MQLFHANIRDTKARGAVINLRIGLKIVDKKVSETPTRQTALTNVLCECLERRCSCVVIIPDHCPGRIELAPIQIAKELLNPCSKNCDGASIATHRQWSTRKRIAVVNEAPGP